MSCASCVLVLLPRAGPRPATNAQRQISYYAAMPFPVLYQRTSCAWSVQQCLQNVGRSSLPARSAPTRLASAAAAMRAIRPPGRRETATVDSRPVSPPRRVAGPERPVRTTANSHISHRRISLSRALPRTTHTPHLPTCDAGRSPAGSRAPGRCATRSPSYARAPFALCVRLMRPAVPGRVCARAPPTRRASGVARAARRLRGARDGQSIR